jgi:hypothetical protein
MMNIYEESTLNFWIWTQCVTPDTQCKGRHLLTFYMDKLQCVSEPEWSSLPNL